MIVLGKIKIWQVNVYEDDKYEFWFVCFLRITRAPLPVPKKKTQGGQKTERRRRTRRRKMTFLPVLRTAFSRRILSRVHYSSCLASYNSLVGNNQNTRWTGFHSDTSSHGGGSMRGAVFWEPNKPLTIEEFHIPRPKAGEILIKTKGINKISLLVFYFFLLQISSTIWNT